MQLELVERSGNRFSVIILEQISYGISTLYGISTIIRCTLTILNTSVVQFGI